MSTPIALIVVTTVFLGLAGFPHGLVGTGSAVFCCPGGGGGGGGGQSFPVCFGNLWSTQQAQVSGPVTTTVGGNYFNSGSCSFGTSTGFELEGPAVTALANSQSCFPSGPSLCQGPYPGAASYQGQYFVNAETVALNWQAASTTQGSVTVTFEFYNWAIQSDSPNGCWDGDFAGGSASAEVAVGVWDDTSSTWLQSPLVLTVPDGALYATCPSSGGLGYGSYSTGSGQVWSTATYVYYESLTNLALQNGISYSIQASVGCSLSGATWGSSMSTDTETQAFTECGPLPAPYDGFGMGLNPTFYS